MKDIMKKVHSNMKDMILRYQGLININILV